MADTFKGIITADGKKRQLPYGSILDKPVSDETLSIQGGFADAKVVGDKFEEVKTEAGSLKGDLINEYSAEYEIETNRVLNADGTLNNGLITAVVSKFIPVAEGEHYRYKGAWYVSERCGVCCYDENKNFVSILVGSSEYSSHKLAELVDFVIPQNAHFIKVASNNITDYPLELVAVEHTIKTLQNDVGTLQNGIKGLDFKNSLNKNLLPLGNNLKLENRFQCFARKSTGFTAGKIESPVVFWDSKLLKYGMTFSGYGSNSDGSLTKGNIGIAWSDDLEHWEVEDEPLFTESNIVGSADYGSVTGGYIFIEDGVYYLFYIGCSESGYEQGTKTICVASGTDIHNLQRSTKNPLIAPTGGYKWTSDAIYKPSVYHIGDKYYMFFNAQGWCDNDTQFFGESIGYATSNDLINWNISEESVVKPTRGDNTAPDSYIVGDASIYDIGDDNIYMAYFAYGHGESPDDSKDWLAFTTKKDFPNGWKKYGIPVTPKKWDAKPCIIYRQGVQYHFCGAGGYEISCYKSN